MAEFTETGAERPRRSCLYMPGTNARAHEKAKTLAADVLIFDLEDSVAPDAKEAARDQVCAAIAAGGFGRREIVVRVNAMDTPWAEADLRAATASGAHGVVLPKVTGPDDVRAAGDLLDAEGAGARLWAMMETARAVLAAPEIAAAHGRRVGLAGRSMARVVQAARNSGYLQDFPPIVSADHLALLPPEEVLVICTGSQGEPRSALWRIANGEHRDISLHF